MLRLFPATILAVNNNIIAFLGCVYVALVIQQAKHMHNISICGRTLSKIFLHVVQ